jgi:hypothetical protein
LSAGTKRGGRGKSGLFNQGSHKGGQAGPHTKVGGPADDGT